MATPIEPTPVFEGEDAEFLLSELAKVHLTEEQRQERREACKKRVEEHMRPKGYRNIVEFRTDISMPGLRVTKITLSPDAEQSLTTNLDKL